MNKTKIFKILSLILLIYPIANQAMKQPEVASSSSTAIQDKGKDPVLHINEYDSDSEDEAGYTYNGLKHVTFSGQHKRGHRCLALCRGSHFSPSIFKKEEISEMRRHDDAGEPICSVAAFDLAGEPIGNTKNIAKVIQCGSAIRTLIASLPPDKRNKFQEIYSNNFDEFHNKLCILDPDGIFHNFTSKKNPQVSTSEGFRHGGKYAAGLKFLGKGIKSLDPEYDSTGKPKHPYLGKLFIILVDESKIQKLAPYFVVWAHANDIIKISTHYSKDILVEREVSFPGLIPGDCVVFSVPVRVPSFAGEWKPWHETKYGLTKRQFNIKKRILKDGKANKSDIRPPEVVRKENTTGPKGVLEKVISHLETTLQEHVKKECETKGISLMYKSLDDGFGTSLPALANATAQRKIIIDPKRKK